MLRTALHCRCCKAFLIHTKFRLGIFTVDVDSIQQNQLQGMSFSKLFIELSIVLDTNIIRIGGGLNQLMLWDLYIDVVQSKCK